MNLIGLILGDGLSSTRQTLMGAMPPPPPPQSDLKLPLGAPAEVVEDQPVSVLSSIDSLGPQKPGIKAHTGIYRTPSKAIICHLCKLTFRSVLGYTQHNLTVHSSKVEK